jgi:regulator of sirC expression with transglutaminase-like and TPR domain
LFDVFGLHGNTEDYYNPANSYMGDVLRTHRGLPISLVLVYKCVAEPLGLTVYGINSPGHFLAEVENSGRGVGGPLYVDPFFGGGLLTTEEVFARLSQATGQELLPSPALLARATHRQWLARMLTNLQAAFTAAGQDRNALAMQELFLLLET